MSSLTEQFIARVLPAVQAAGVDYPEAWVAEAALESAWGQSGLFRKALNPWGQKLGFSSREFPVLDLSTGEVVKGRQVWEKHCYWPVYPDLTTAARERLELLRLAKHHGPRPCATCGRLPGSLIYADALAAKGPVEFLVRVSRHWATDPERGHKAIGILTTYFPRAVPLIAKTAAAPTR